MLIEVCAAMGAENKTDRVDLSDLVVVANGRAPQPVRYAVDELVRFARVSGDVAAIVVDRPAVGSALQLLVGRALAEDVLGGEACRRLGLNEELGREGFVLRALESHKPPTVIAAGWTDAGTRWAVYEFIKALDVTTRPAALALPLARRERPDFALRGMYAHQHWDYRFPYALRTWRVEDWNRYVDLLAYFRYNLFQIWSMAGIMPVPLSPADEAFLRKYPAVIEHAHRNHGMEVWIGECANNVCEKSGLPPLEARDYFGAETLKNPGDPQQLRELMDARRVLYSIVDNADGYWIIDSDPGRWPGSPADQFVDILVANRRVIDETSRLGPRAKLVYWMWQSWGTGSRQENWLQTVRGLKQRVHAPLWFSACWPDHTRIVGEEGVSSTTIYYPYNAVEPEPSMPFTTVVPERLRRAVAVGAEHREFAGTMGNAQTPLVQLPNIAYFGRSAWRVDDRSVSRERIAADLARLIFPARARELARGWLALAASDPDEARAAALDLEQLLARQALGPPGPVGWKITPRPELVVEDLVMMLNLHVSGMAFRRKAEDPNAPDEEVIALFRDYVLLTVAWRHRNGFKKSPWDPYTSPPVYSTAHKRWGTADGLPERILRPLRDAIATRYGPDEAAYTLEPVSPKKRP